MNVLPPVKAIRAYCLDCCNWQAYEVTHCTRTQCELYPYRMGHNPNRKGVGPKNPTFTKKEQEEEG